jgi:hypothetical protein
MRYRIAFVMACLLVVAVVLSNCGHAPDYCRDNRAAAKRLERSNSMDVADLAAHATYRTRCGQ